MSVHFLRQIIRCLGSAALVAGAFAAHAQSFPSKPIRLVVPSAPGGSLDILGRALGRALEEQPGLNVVVDNRAGASGSIGVLNVIRSPADGYTILISVPDAVTIYPLVNEKVKYRWDRDLTPLVRLGASSSVYSINAKSPANSVKEFVALSQKGSFNYATQGPGSSGHLLMEAFKTATGAKMTHIPYKGIAPGMLAVITGESDIISSSMASATPHLQGGNLKLLATTRPTRYPSYPNVPTMAESGYPELALETWFGVFAPAGLKPDVAERLIQVLSTAVSSAAFREQMLKYGIESKPATGAAFGKVVADDTAFWKSIIDRSNVKVEE